MSVVRGDALHLPVRDGSVQCCVTSPPYYALRDYRGASSRWPAIAYSPMPGLPALEIPAMECQLGHEPTVEGYVGHLVAVFRRVREALHESGTLWLNLGDTAAASGRGGGGKQRLTVTDGALGWRASRGVAEGNRLGVPWRVAFALQADGWVLRSSIVWHKPAPMPESVSGWSWRRCRVKAAPAPRADGEKKGEVWRANGKPQGARGAKAGDSATFASAATWTDCPGCQKCDSNDGLVLRRGSWRPTTSHEMLFLFARSERYFCDAEAVREAPQGPARRRRYAPGPAVMATRPDNAPRMADSSFGESDPSAGRNPRDVWTIGSAPLAEDHFAAFPPALVERCILAGTPAAGVCSACGEPWAPVVDSYRTPDGERFDHLPAMRNTSRSAPSTAQGVGHWRTGRVSTVEGWRPCCSCGAPPRPAVVLDSFGGSGTTARVAAQLGRTGVSVDVEAGYCAMARARVDDVVIDRRAARTRRAAAVEGPLFDTAEPPAEG